MIEIQDAANHPIPDTTATWEVKQGGGNVSDSLTTTDSNGKVQTTLTLGTTVGTNKVNAVKTGVSGSPMSFTATANPDILHHYYIDAPSVALIIFSPYSTIFSSSFNLNSLSFSKAMGSS